MNLPSLSVLIPNYNHAGPLPRCLEAIAGQSVQPLEIIILDDASTDHSPAVIRDFASRHPQVRFERNPVNRGVVYGMNRLLELAQGEYVYFAAADDQALPGIFEKSLGLLEQHPRAALSCGICEWRELDTGWTRYMGVRMADRPEYLAPARMVELEKKGRLLISSHTAVLKREAIVRAGGFIPELKYHCDWFALYVAGFRDGICYIPEPLALFNIHTASYSVTQSKAGQRAAHRQVLRTMLNLLGQPDYQDAAGPIRQSGALYFFGKPMLALVLGTRRFRPFRTRAFLRKAAWQAFKLEVKKITPRCLAQWYFRLSGQHVPLSDPPKRE